MHVGTGIFFSAVLNRSYCRWRGRPGIAKGNGNVLGKGEWGRKEGQGAVENTRFR